MSINCQKIISRREYLFLKFLNLDLASYSQGFEELLKKTHEITGDILLTSPSDFSGLDEFLEKSSLSR